MHTEDKKPSFPSIHDAKPTEEGGPAARIGFNYQDEIAVSLLLEMLESDNIECIYCETQDDVVIVFNNGFAECIQIKANDSISAWTTSNITVRTNGQTGTSIYEKSLARDAVSEVMSFRLITLRDVSSDLSFLKYPIGKPGREPNHKNVTSLCAELEKRCPNSKSPKGNDSRYWVDKCKWDVPGSKISVAHHNLIRLHQLGAKLGLPLLLEPLEVLLDELRKKVKDAGSAKWEPDKEIKVFQKSQMEIWLKRRLIDIEASVSGASGGKLQDKLTSAGLSHDLIRLAADMRRGR